jgi:2-dehydro-3-deoxygluconokinase
VDNIRWVNEDDARTGMYFLEEGVDPRPSAVTYDRKNTAISQVDVETFDWDAILDGAAAFHVSGITMALSPGARRATMRAVETASKQGVLVSFDLNYRSKLWSEAEARDAFVEVVPMVDVLFASKGALGTFFGIEGSRDEVMRGAIERLGVAAVSISRKKARGSRGLRLQNLALGPSGVLATSAWRDIEVVDRLGGGDAFAAGFLAGYLENPAALSQAVELGAAASALKHTMPGDFLCATRAEIEAAMTAEGAGVLQR